MPFVQGQLRNEPLSFTIHSHCAHCGHEMNIEIDSDLKTTLPENTPDPVIFIPLVDFVKLEDPSIIDAF